VTHNAATVKTDPAHTPVIVDGLRTAFGRYGGALSGIRPDDMAAHVIRALIDRTGVDPELVDDVILGAANQAGEDNRNGARMALLLAGLPVEVPGQTVNRLCGSGLQAVVSAAHAIAFGDGSVFVAGGAESMSRAPFVMAKPSAAFPRGEQTMYDTTLGWRFTNPRLADAQRTSSTDAASRAKTRMPSHISRSSAGQPPMRHVASPTRSSRSTFPQVDAARRGPSIATSIHVPRRRSRTSPN
jgi:acetyl-CoA acetyltransferase